MRHMNIKLYFRINPIPRLEIDRAVTNGSAVYILLGEILCPDPSCIQRAPVTLTYIPSLVQQLVFLVVDLHHLFGIVKVLFKAVVVHVVVLYPIKLLVGYSSPPPQLIFYVNYI